MQLNSEFVLPIADMPSEEFLPLFTPFDPISNGPLSLNYPIYPPPFSTGLLGNSPQSSNAKPKKHSLAPITPTHIRLVQNYQKNTLNSFVNFAFGRGSGVYLT